MHSDQYEKLRSECTVNGGRFEGACQLLCGYSLAENQPWIETEANNSELRLLVHAIDSLAPDEVSSSENSVGWDMGRFVSLMKKARDEDLVVGICHSHPKNSSSSFSDQDDRNEAHLRDVLERRNHGLSQMLVSVLFRGDGHVDARVWSAQGPPTRTNVRVIGKTVTEWETLQESSTASSEDFLQRQELSIGKETVRKLRQLRIGVIGCGGTGSAITVLLARAGIGHLLLVDSDIVEETNLNRLHGSTRKDVQERRLKVCVLKDHVDSMNLGTHVVVCPVPLIDSSTARLLRSCDFLFGCTDDHLGRLILNRLAYFYYVPVIDTGLSVKPFQSDRPAQIQGRVTVLRPGNTCLLCRGLINPRTAMEDGLRHHRPEEYERQIKEGYITNRDIPTPVVGTFTTETATAAVNELLAGVAALRGCKGWSSERRIRYDLDMCRPTGFKSSPHCPVCASEYDWGRGDVQPFLDLSLA